MEGKNEVGGRIIEDNVGNYLAFGSSTRILNPVLQGMIWKISSTGDTLSKTFVFGDSVSLIGYVTQIENGNYMAVAAVGASTSDFQKLVFLELDVNLDLLSKKEVVLPGIQAITTFHMKKHLQSYYLFLGDYGLASNPPNLRDPYLVKFNSNFDTVLTRRYSIYGDQSCNEIMFSPDGSQIWLLSESYFPELISSCSVQLIVYDTLFNYQRVKTLNWTDMMGLSKAKWITDSTFLLAYNHKSSPMQEDIAITETDSTFLFNDYTLISSVDTIDYIGFGTALDFITPDSIHYVGTKNLVPEYWPQQPSWIRIGMLNRQLEPVYERFYGGDAFYCAFSVLSTSDGGAFVAASRYDHNQHNNYNDMFFLKVDNQGLVTMNSHPGLCPLQPALVYPNPARDKIFIDLSWDNAKCSINDIMGKQLLQSYLYNGKNLLNINGIAPGCYILIVNRDQYQTFTHKVIIY